jgi:hypothetical protein
MKLYVKIPEGLNTHFEAELALSRQCFRAGELSRSWRHLERAHILGQAWPLAHTRAHWHMLIFGLRIKDLKEILGQLPRLLTGGVKSFVGKIPTGNTGGANVPPLRPMEIPDDLKAILSRYRS